MLYLVYGFRWPWSFVIKSESFWRFHWLRFYLENKIWAMQTASCCSPVCVGYNWNVVFHFVDTYAYCLSGTDHPKIFRDTTGDKLLLLLVLQLFLVSQGEIFLSKWSGCSGHHLDTHTLVKNTRNNLNNANSLGVMIYNNNSLKIQSRKKRIHMSWRNVL